MSTQQFLSRLQRLRAQLAEIEEGGVEPSEEARYNAVRNRFREVVLRLQSQRRAGRAPQNESAVNNAASPTGENREPLREVIGAAHPESDDAVTQREQPPSEQVGEPSAREESAATATTSDPASADTGAARPESSTTTQSRRRSAEDVQQALGRIERELQEIMASLRA
jgi:hypothetical protein